VRNPVQETGTRNFRSVKDQSVKAALELNLKQTEKSHISWKSDQKAASGASCGFSDSGAELSVEACF